MFTSEIVHVECSFLLKLYYIFNFATEPDEVSLIGTDNHDICKILNPKLSSISLPIEKMAKDISNHTIECLTINEKEVIDKLYSFNIITDSVSSFNKM
ncbi:substrate-binding domain-containing protein [Staphylococcus intermedius]|uniref:substrate-binding domain-containing protein n=1 Tax=Staphylococcus intermedius TaxID=1285 RepID=UPI001FD05076|nr:substrate-binding domain-containing protein [Staphylococcus intermedius]